VPTSAGSTPLAYVVNCGLPGNNPDPPQAHGVFHDLVNTSVTMSLDYLSQHDGSATTLMRSENVAADNWIDTGEANVGFNWQTGSSPPANSRINENINGDHPRPSSYHNGGVIVSFCDGHQYFLREDIAYHVYQHLCTPDSRLAGVTDPDGTYRPLDEGAY